MMHKTNDNLVGVFDKVREVLEEGLHESEKTHATIQAYRNILDIPIPDDPKLETLKKESESLKSACLKDELASKQHIVWLRTELVILKALSQLFYQTFEEMDSLKDTLRGMGVEIKDVKSLQEKREEVFDKIDKFADEIRKRNEEEREKWR